MYHQVAKKVQFLVQKKTVSTTKSSFLNKKPSFYNKKSSFYCNNNKKQASGENQLSVLAVTFVDDKNQNRQQATQEEDVA